MRRSRAPLTAWPAFADLMTILAVAALAFAAVAADPEALEAALAELQQAKNTIEGLNQKVRSATRTESDLRRRLRKASERIEVLRIGARPCLRTGDSLIVPLLSVEVAPALEFIVSRLWSSEYDSQVSTVAGVSDVVERRLLDRGEFEQHAARILAYGDREDTFGGSCRFFVELQIGDADSLSFPRAYGIVNQYFLISNPGETNRILRGEE